MQQDRPRRDPTLTHHRSVYQHLVRHFARYTPEMVEQVCGIPRDQFLEIADRYTACSGPDRTATICYAVGLTQHSVGAQIVRSAAILQLLLGNIGRPGGGVLALRGHASIQGSTDIPTLYDLLPGYLPMPQFGAASSTLGRYIVRHRTKAGWWAHLDKYIVSLLKAWYGDAATVDNDFGFGWLPRISGDHSHQGYWLEMADGRMDGLFVMGQNPAVGAPNAALERRAMANLEWLVIRDMVEVETATFWKDSPEVQRGERAARSDQDGGVLFPGRRSCRKARHVYQHPATVAVAREGRRAAGRLPIGRLVRPRARQAAQSTRGRRRAAMERRPACADVGLSNARAAWRTGCGGDSSGDQRLSRRSRLVRRAARVGGRRR